MFNIKTKLLTRIITFVMLITMLFTNAPNVSAKDNLDKVENNILIQVGLSQEAIDHMSLGAKQNLIEAYKKDTSSVTAKTVVMEVDVLSEIDAYVNATPEEKIKYGLDDEKIKKMDNEIEILSDMSDKEMKDKFDMDDVTVKLIREAIEPDKDYQIKNEATDIQASGSITTSEMTYSQSAINNSTSTGVNYDVYLNAWWKDWYVFGAFDDKVAVVWGGNLTQYSNYQYVDYYIQNHDSTWGGLSESRVPAYHESIVNAGGYYYFPQSLSSAKARNVEINFKLKQSGRNNQSTKILSQFCHQTLGIDSSISISASGLSVSLKPGTSYDSTAQHSDVIYN